MKHIKNFGMNEINTEISLIYEIIRFFEINGLYRVNTSLKKITTIVYDYFNDGDNKKWIYKLINGEKDGIMVGIERYKGVETYTKILNYLKNLSSEEIDRIKLEQNVKKYNL